MSLALTIELYKYEERYGYVFCGMFSLARGGTFFVVCSR